jgi:hypothetical protein
MEIRIQQTFGSIGIRTEPSTIRLEQNVMPRANINMSLGDMKIDGKQSMVKIDGSRAQAEVGLKNITYSLKEVVSDANQHAFQTIQSLAAEGDFYARVPSQGNHFALWEMQKSLREEVDLTLVAAPSVGSLQIDFTEPSFNIKVDPYQISVDPNLEPVRVQANWAKIDIYEKQKYDVRISMVKGKAMDWLI